MAYLRFVLVFEFILVFLLVFIFVFLFLLVLVLVLVFVFVFVFRKKIPTASAVGGDYSLIRCINERLIERSVEP